MILLAYQLPSIPAWLHPHRYCRLYLYQQADVPRCSTLSLLPHQQADVRVRNSILPFFLYRGKLANIYQAADDAPCCHRVVRPLCFTRTFQ